MKKHLFKITFCVIVIIILCSCSRTITGNVTAIHGDTITVNNKRFVVDSIPVLGQYITVKPTSNFKKVNAKKVN